MYIFVYMIKSMTGYGSASHENEYFSLSVEVKSLNSKFLDFSYKAPKELSDLEVEIKNLVTKKLVRGKVNLSLELITKKISPGQTGIDQFLFKKYFEELTQLAEEYQINSPQIFGQILSIPEVVKPIEPEMDRLDQKVIFDLISEALEKCSEFRIQEGSALEKIFLSCVENIKQRLDEIGELEPLRKQSVKERLKVGLEELNNVEKVDENRFEQEIIYYIEKLDISEEIVRLKNHLEYFDTTLREKDAQGKKLGFISQEIGREINTIGSKANDAAIQRLVVDMKDELEKIKEQILNIV